jgi:hypothetical protein
VDAFATVDDLAALLNREFTEPEEEWMTVLLESASTYLRDDVIGQQVYPQATVTYDDYPTAGRVDLPQYPVVSIVSVKRDDAAVDYSYRPGYITVDGDDPVEITYTYGYATAPDRLRDLACVLVSSALLTLEAQIGLTAGGLSSVALDDFKLAWADAGAQSGMVLPEIQKADLRRTFGRGGVQMVDTGR